MKNLTYCGIFIALFATTHLSAGNGDKSVKPVTTPVFTDCPAITETDPALLEAAKAVVPATITVYGSGGYSPNTGAVCPDSASSICAYIITEMVSNGNYGPDAKVEDAKTRKHYAGVIAGPIYNDAGDVINFRFSSLRPID